MPAVARAVVLLVAVWAIASAGRTTIEAQVRPAYDSGAAGLTHLLARLQTTASVLHTGAHPDDEDSAFIARTARGDHARVAYLSLTRGEGGQNIIGPELAETLGVIRTEELLQARRLDGGEQFFTRAIDFGFSKTLAEAASMWNEGEILGDIVRVIRLFRPLVVYSRYGGTPDDGHGQHQFAGFLTPRAFAAAGDPTQFPEHLAEGLHPWQPLKLYRGSAFRADETAAALQVQTGVLDPIIGRSYAAIAAEGRSQHKSQQMGTIEPVGVSSSSLRLVETRVPATTGEASVFAGMDTTIPGLAGLAGLPEGALAPELRALSTALAQAFDAYQPRAPDRLVPLLTASLRAVRGARAAVPSAPGTPDSRDHADFLLGLKEADLIEAIVLASGVIVDPLADQETVTPGGSVGVTVRTFLERPNLVRVTGSVLRVPPDWRAESASLTNDREGRFRREMPTVASAYRVTSAAATSPTQPYFLATPRSGHQYQWDGADARGRPFDPPLMRAEVSLSIDGLPLTVVRAVQYRLADGVRGELRRYPDVVPALSVGVEPDLLIVPTGSPRTHRLVVHASSFASGTLNGRLTLQLPAGWSSEPSSFPLALSSRGEGASFAFSVTSPALADPASLAIGARADVDGRQYSDEVKTVAYPHIQTHHLQVPARIAVEVMDIVVAPVHVGYIMGSGDDVPDALARLGIQVTSIDRQMLATGDLSRFDTIVVGVRASEARPDFVANHGRLRQYMERGGTLIVQYQQTDYVARDLPPYPVQSSGNSRVTDESAPVRILAPKHPVFTFPNRIGEADFDGWVQERNLYAFGSLDAQYTPLLESADPGEPPQRGGQVYAQVGKGRYVYTSYTWFRQLRAGVPGAYRQFANLVSLPKAPPEP